MGSPGPSPDWSLPALPLGWEYEALEDLLEANGISYGIVQPGFHDPVGVPIVRVRDMRLGRVVQDNPLRVHPTVEEKHSRTRIRGGEVLLSLVGSVGETALAPSCLSGWNVARAIAVLRPLSRVSSSWIRICLSYGLAQHHMKMWQNTTVQATLNLRDLRRIPIVMPPLADRRSITALLEAIDDKTAVNERIAATADEAIAARFAGALAEAPEGFIERPLSQVVEFINGPAATKGATGRGRMVVRIAEMNRGPGPSTVYSELQVPDRHLTRPGDVLFAWSGSLTVARWFRPEAIINQHIFKAIPKHNGPAWLAFELVRSKLDEFRVVAAGKATTMGHIQRRHLDEPVPAPTSELLPRLDAQLGLLWDRALAAEQESLALVALREALLPQLVSGKLRLRAAERMVEDAV